MSIIRDYLLPLAAVLMGSLPACASGGAPEPHAQSEQGMPLHMHDHAMEGHGNSPSGVVETSAYTKNHVFLIKLTELPNPLPYQRYFTVHLAVYASDDPDRLLKDADVGVTVGMRHGMTEGFAHGMQSSPKIEGEGGDIRVEGVYLHMMGEWAMEVRVDEGGKQDVANFDLPCCGE